MGRQGSAGGVRTWPVGAKFLAGHHADLRLLRDAPHAADVWDGFPRPLRAASRRFDLLRTAAEDAVDAVLDVGDPRHRVRQAGARKGAFGRVRHLAPRAEERALPAAHVVWIDT